METQCLNCYDTCKNLELWPEQELLIHNLSNIDNNGNITNYRCSLLKIPVTPKYNDKDD